MAGRQDYEERKQERIERLENAAIRASNESKALNKRSDELVSQIPMGQPIITGRGAATRADINRREKSWALVGKAIEADNKASYYAEAADNAKNNTAISSDDPNSIEKLKAKVDSLTAEKEFYKAINAYHRKHNTCKGFVGADGAISDEQAEELDEEAKNGFCTEGRPVASFTITNLNQRIKAAQERIKRLEATDEMPATQILYAFGKIESNPETNRVAITFNERIPDEWVAKLKLYGFKWAYSVGKWQRMRSSYSLQTAKEVMEYIDKQRVKE